MNRLHHLAVNKDGFVFDPTTGESFTANPTGLLVLERLIAGDEPQDISELLTDRFEVDAAEAGRDVSDFIESLRAHRLI